MKTDVYLLAAQLVDSGEERMSCLAVEVATNNKSGKWRDETRLYKQYFCWSYDIRQDSPGFSFGGGNFGKDDDERRKNRVLALLLMHWIAKDLP